MINCENEVYTKIVEVLKAKFEKINISNKYISTPSSFPHVSIIQSDNSIIPSYTTTVSEMAQVMFEINIYSNKTLDNKEECEHIAKLIDEVLFFMNFRRMTMSPVPNMEDTKVYRIVARYRAATDGNNFYRR
mgnify:FL=1